WSSSSGRGSDCKWGRYQCKKCRWMDIPNHCLTEWSSSSGRCPGYKWSGCQCKQ
ncbi:hypothetical protein B0I35DRAFT_441919, partial [Stachybotrys elegans]